MDHPRPVLIKYVGLVTLSGDSSPYTHQSEQELQLMTHAAHYTAAHYPFRPAITEGSLPEALRSHMTKWQWCKGS